MQFIMRKNNSKKEILYHKCGRVFPFLVIFFQDSYFIYITIDSIFIIFLIARQAKNQSQKGVKKQAKKKKEEAQKYYQAQSQ